ncbi:hypothetical protein WKI13_00015 [Teredinibacter turnerae]|uniref:hypothetical protein n=1 Tax=Teredinibacter turnerae TaxID=2426 RepID=UPI0003629974|nr:hypothetical protein [Teredinibacter turnerae]
MDNDVILSEFNCLKEETLAMTQRRSQRLTITWTALAAFSSVAFSTELPELTLLSIVFVTAAWREDLAMVRKISGIGGYIQYFIEPRLKELSWESVTSRSVDRSERSTFSRLRSTMRSNYGIATMTAYFVVLSSLLKYPITHYSRAVVFALLAGLACWHIHGVIRLGCFVREKNLAARERFKNMQFKVHHHKGRSEAPRAA